MVIEVAGYYDDNLWKRSSRHGIFACYPVFSPGRRAMELYARLLEERAEEERRRGGSLLECALDSKVLARRLEDGRRRRPGHAPDLAMMQRLIRRGPRNAGEVMRLNSLKVKYRGEYGELRAGRRSQEELL
ncbi:MAG: hypothetical protein M3P49_15285 [Actinomycetota bacterium]|nr:hypothetical protein [Actinomycetota bacterium]